MARLGPPLRLEAESTPPRALCEIAQLAFDVADTICWQALASGEVKQFTAVASLPLAVELHDFAECADLLD